MIKFEMKMNTQIVYVLVSNEKDYYTEQFFISSYSVRIFNPNARIVLLTDNGTYSYLKGKCLKALQYIDDIVSIEFPDDCDNKRRSRYLKTSIRNLIDGDFLFIDTDTVICDDLSEIDNISSPMAAVYDMHVPLKRHLAYNDIKLISEHIGYSLKEEDKYFNSGVMFVKDMPQTREFYKRWNDNYENAIKRNVTTDQQALIKTNSEFGIIEELDGIWNCQIINNLSFLNKAKIIHYFCTGMNKGNPNPPYKFMSKNTCANIRENGFDVDKVLMDDIINAKSLFSTPLVILAGEDVIIKSSLQFFLLSQLYYRHKEIFNIIERIIAGCRKIFRIFK